MKLLLLLLFSDDDESLRRGHRALDRACTTTLMQDMARRTVKVTVVEVPAVADKRWDSMKEVEEDEVGIQGDDKYIGYYYCYSVCI